MRKITPFLWFNGQAEEAARFYVALFRNSSVGSITRAGPSGPVMTVAFELDGQPLIALNGGSQHPHTPAFSLMVDCADQAEVDRLWDRLISGGGKPSMCGWLVDRFGLSWQIIPTVLTTYLADPDPARAQRVAKAMLAMQKIDIAALHRAYGAAA